MKQLFIDTLTLLKIHVLSKDRLETKASTKASMLTLLFNYRLAVNLFFKSKKKMYTTFTQPLKVNFY